MTAKNVFRIAVALVLAVTCGAPALAAGKGDTDPKKTPSRLELIRKAKQATARPQAGVAVANDDEARNTAAQGFEAGRKAKEEAEQRSRIGEIEASRAAILERMRAQQGTQGQNGRPDPAKAREQGQNALPIRPQDQPDSPFTPKDPQQARDEALARLKSRVTSDLKEETMDVPDPRAPKFPAASGIPGMGRDQIGRLKGVTQRMPGPGAGPQPYDSASMAKGKRPFFNLQHNGGGEQVWRCAKYCAENGYTEGELVDGNGLPGNAVRDDVSDMTTTEKLCRDNPKLCEEAGRSDRKPGENDEEYWDRKANEALAARKKREEKKLEEKANKDCSKIKSPTARRSCEFDAEMARRELERRREEERKKREAEQKKKTKKKSGNGDCAVMGGPGSDCDSLPENDLVNWHRENQRKLLDAARGPRYQGTGNIDPERGPSWHTGLAEKAVEILGVDDPPEDAASAGDPAPREDCSITPGTGAIDMGPDHLGPNGNPGCETDTPTFDSGETLTLEDDDEDEKEEDAAASSRR